MMAGEAPPGRKGWHIELAPLDATNAPPAEFVWLRNAALCTSSDLFQHLEIDGKRYSHIVDPRTGLGLTDRSLVTVIAPTSAMADALATAVSVLGPEQGLTLIESTSGTAARVVRKPGDEIQVVHSRRFDRFQQPEAGP
jgi:thiamine biosynthesis lipoprotein